MKEFWAVLFRNSLARDYAIAGTVFCVLAVIGVHAVSELIGSVRQQVRVEQANLTTPQSDFRNYQISRSVLDDTVITGSIGGTRGQPIILDPCTGAVKQR